MSSNPIEDLKGIPQHRNIISVVAQNTPFSKQLAYIEIIQSIFFNVQAIDGDVLPRRATNPYLFIGQCYGTE